MYNRNKRNCINYGVLLIFMALFIKCDNAVTINTQTNDNIPIEFSIEGDGTPVFLVGGLLGMGSNYLTSVSKNLSENGYKVYLINIRNVCNEDINDYQDLTLNKITDDLERLRVKEGIEKIHLFGDLFGTIVCMNYSLKYKESVNKIILSNPIGISSNDFEKPLYTQYLNKFEPNTKQMYIEVLSNDNYISDSLFRKKTNSLITLDNLTNKTLHNQVNNTFFNENCYSLLTEFILDRNLRKIKFNLGKDLSKIYSSVLIIYGEKDSFCKEHSNKIDSLYPNSELVEIGNTKQFTWIENSEIFYLNLDKFLKK
jgi:proline iminopeptidase